MKINVILIKQNSIINTHTHKHIIPNINVTYLKLFFLRF